MNTFLFLGTAAAAVGSLQMWYEMLTLLTLTGNGAALFAGGIGTVLVTLVLRESLA